jgi:CRP/FNR family transcriptional regulator
MDLTTTIAALPLFEGLPRPQIEDLAMIVMEQVVRKGQIVFSEGDEGIGFYVVLEGRVKVFKLSMDGKEQILHIFGPGEPFGEVPVFSGQKFPASAATMEDSRLLFFPRDGFVALVRKTPELALNMLAILSRRLRRFASLIEDLSLKEVPARLSAYLLYLKRANRGSQDLTLDISKAQLASLLGTIPETLSRILTKMSKQGLIQTDGPKIRILDLEALEDLAEAGGGL